MATQDQDPIVVTSGALIASILHRQVCATGDEDGFFIGKVENSVVNTISDSHAGEREENVFVNIYDFVPCPSLFYFYNYIGDIDNRSLNELLKERDSAIVGWYKLRRESTLQMSSREKQIQKNLQQMIGEPNFIFGLFISTSTCKPITQDYQHAFFKQKGNTFGILKWKTANLHSAESLSYRYHNSTALNRKSETFKETIQSCKEHSNEQSQYITGNALAKAFMDRFDPMISQLIEKQERSKQLDMEIKRLELLLESNASDNHPVEPLESNASDNHHVEPLNVSSKLDESEEILLHLSSDSLKIELEECDTPDLSLFFPQKKHGNTK